jgi:hypothetical protein
MRSLKAKGDSSESEPVFMGEKMRYLHQAH